jgi:hypothetical protein
MKALTFFMKGWPYIILAQIPTSNNKKKTFFRHNSSGSSNGRCTRTVDLRMMKGVHCHCTAALAVLILNFKASQPGP